VARPRVWKEGRPLSRVNFCVSLLWILCGMAPLWLLKGVTRQAYPEPQNPVVAVLIDSAHSFLQLFTSVVLFRLFMLISVVPEKTDGPL